MEVRFLTPEDASAWLKLRLEALRGDPEAFSASLEEYEPLSLDEVCRRLWSAAEAFVVGAFHEEQLIGVAGFFPDKGLKSCHKSHVWGVYVTPAHRRTGVARQMMQKILQRAAAIEGVEQVLLSVAVTQTAAAKLYRSLGFRSFGCEPRAIKLGDRYIDEESLILTSRMTPKTLIFSGSRREKRPRSCNQGRLGSPPPELPNHEWIVRFDSWSVNVTLVMELA